MERVILRREYNPFSKGWGYLAIFPDDEANPGRVGAISFYFNSFDKPVFEPYCEISLGYMYKQKIIHKNEDDVSRCLKALNNMYDTEFTVCEKMSKPRRKNGYLSLTVFRHDLYNKTTDETNILLGMKGE